MYELERVATIGFDENEAIFANGRVTNCGGMPVSRVPDAGSSDCQLSNDARISQKMPVSLKNMAELDYINLDSIELKLCSIVTNVVVTNVFFFFFFFTTERISA